MLSKSNPTIEPPAVIKGTNASAKVFNEYAEICIAVETSCQLAAIKSSPRHAAGAKPIECSTPSTRPRCFSTSVRALTTCSSTVTSNSMTSTCVDSFFAARCVIERPRPAPVSTIFAPSCWASCATPKASDASVKTPVMTMFLPERIPTRSTVVGRGGVLSCATSERHD